MLGDIIAILRLLIDPQLRSSVAAVRESATRSGQAWSKQLKRSHAKFAGDEGHLVGVFANNVRDDFRSVGASEKATSRFETVFAELVENALRHGCQYRHNCKVSVTCDYSRWFLQLRVVDSGKGFPFETYRRLPYYQQHGLGVVSKLAARFDANTKGNVVTALITSHDDISVEVGAMPPGDDILYLIVSNDELWHYSRENWEPLRSAIDESGQNLVLVDCKKVSWSSARTRMLTQEILNAFTDQPGRRIAYILSAEALQLFDFSRLDSGNSKVFRTNQYEQARNWLVSATIVAG